MNTHQQIAFLDEFIDIWGKTRDCDNEGVAQDFLTELYNVWLKAEGLPPSSADELRHDLAMNKLENSPFPNGFDNWQETHFEIVAFITHQLSLTECENCTISVTHEEQGTGGMYILAEQWTNDFEKLYAGKQWDGEYFDVIEEFCQAKNRKS